MLGTAADDVRAMLEGSSEPMGECVFPENGFLASTLLKRFCVTAKGFIGLVPPGTREGDELCIVLGSQTPFVVRPASADGGHRRDVAPEEEDGAKELREYSLVGECYVHGMMDGEMMCRERETDIRIW
jgi:hypothetical protein